MSRRVFAAAVLAFLCALPCAAQDDTEGAKDHPMFSRMPGYYIDDYDANDFGGVDLYLEPVQQVEGRFWQITYRIKGGAEALRPFADRPQLH